MFLQKSQVEPSRGKFAAEWSKSRAIRHWFVYFKDGRCGPGRSTSIILLHRMTNQQMVPVCFLVFGQRLCMQCSHFGVYLLRKNHEKTTAVSHGTCETTDKQLLSVKVPRTRHSKSISFAMCFSKVWGQKDGQGYPVETKNKCMQCGIALCLVPCSREYHNNIDN